jgi:dTMP kinase
MVRTRRRRGLFITFEGIDGCGKTTQAILVYKLLRTAGHEVVLLREPGSTRVAERIRKILLDRRLAIDPITELLLYEAARANIASHEIEPALKRGGVVMCDRFHDSTTAYQGYGRRLDVRMVRNLHKVAIGDLVPDITFLLDVDLPTALARRGAAKDRLESQSRAFFKRVRSGFLEIARLERRRIKVIDAGRPIEAVFDEIKKHLARKISLQ